MTDGTSYAFSTHSNNIKRHLNHNIRLGINYHLAKDHLLSFAYTSQLNNTRGTSEDDGDFTSLLRIHAKSQFHNFRLDYSTPFGFSAGAEYTYYNSPDEQWLKAVSTMRFTTSQASSESTNGTLTSSRSTT